MAEQEVPPVVPEAMAMVVAVEEVAEALEVVAQRPKKMAEAEEIVR